MKIKVIKKNKNTIVGYVDQATYSLFSSDEIQFIASTDMLFNSSGMNGYFTSQKTGEEFISLSLIKENLSKKTALELLQKI